MLTMLTAILLQAQAEPSTGSLIETGLKINPYGLTVYGALVVVLAIVAWRLYKDLHKEREASKDLAKEAMILMTKLEERLPSVKEFTEIKVHLEEMKRTLEEIRKKE